MADPFSTAVREAREVRAALDSGHNRAEHPEPREHAVPCTQRAASPVDLQAQADAPALDNAPEWARGPALDSVRADPAERRDLCRLRVRHRARSGREAMREGDASSIPRPKKAR